LYNLITLNFLFRWLSLISTSLIFDETIMKERA
jgi:hypothetical protein